MSNESRIGNRLREERERLCLSQALFAGKMGISRMSQVNYETGKRLPDAGYLFAASEAGVDITYVITGKRATAPDFFRMATVFVLESIQAKTGFAEDVLSFVIEALSDAATSSWMEDRLEMAQHPDAEWDMGQWVHLVQLDEMISALFTNARLLRDIFGAVNYALAFGGDRLRVSGEKRASMVLMLFRAFKLSGEVDTHVVDEAVKLAAN